MNHLLAALRSLRRRPAFAAGVIGVLAVALSASTALFSDGAPVVVAGVLPADFWFFPVLDRSIELFLPLPLDRAKLPREERTAFVYARLREHVSVPQAQSELDSLYRAAQGILPARTRSNHCGKQSGVQHEAGRHHQRAAIGFTTPTTS